MDPSYRVRLQEAVKILTASVGILSLVPQQVDGVVMLAPGTTLPGQAYIDYGTHFASTMVAIRRVSATTGAVSYGSGVLVNHSSGTQIVLTAAHVLDSLSGLRPAQNLSIITGSNYFTPTSTTPVERYVVHPTYVVGSGVGTGSQIDLAVIFPSSRIPESGVQIANQFIPTGIAASFSGYGQHGLSYQSLQPKDGHLRAFQSLPIDPSGIFDNAIYNSSFGSSLISNQFLGNGANGDSGGGVFYDNRLHGIMTAASEGTTVYVDILSSNVQSFINDSIPQTGSPQITANVISTLIQLTFCCLTPTREYRVMRSPTLSGWQEAHGFTATSATYSWSEAVSPGGKMFYRLEWDE